MKASEVLRRYQAGEREFRRANLRGQNFKGRNLSGADFSEAEICGANFSNAILRGANFNWATAGMQKRWILVQLLLLLVMAILSGVLQGYFGYFIAYYFPRWWISTYNWNYFTEDVVITTVCFITIVTVFIAIARQGLTVRTIASIIGTVIVAGIVAVVIEGTVPDTNALAVAVAFAGAFAGVLAVELAVAVAFAAEFIVAGIVAGTVAVLVAVAVAGAGAVLVAVAVAGAVEFAVALAVAVAITSLGLGIYCSRRALKGDEKFALLRTMGVAFGALGGTSFCGADLTGANFSHANLKSTNFNHTQQNQTILTHVCWQEAKKLDRARVGDSILANAAVRDLLVTRNGYKKFYVDANLGGANLNGVNLNEANLKGADLSGATFHHANLKAANLREVLAIGADFTGAYLTGACLEAWNIDYTTRLEQVDCQYVFLLEHPNELGNRERRPHDPDQVFQPGDFEKLYRKMINVVQVLLRNGMNRAAFAEAFQQLMDEHPDISYDSIQAIERKGDDALVTLEVSATADKAKISRSLQTFYEEKVRQLEAKVDRLNELRAADLKEVALAQRETQIFNQLVGGNAMNESTDQSQNFNVGGNFNINATNSVVNLRDISGNVTNTINQLPDRPDSTEPDLKQLLLALQAAIETEPNLPDPDKVEALEQVGTLAKAGQNPQDSTLKKLANTAVKVLKGTVAALPDAAQLAEACTKLLPMITTLIGL
ncbi:MAG: hypothetical protein Kow00121_22120 [Elainellaceae cyanobacterium]